MGSFSFCFQFFRLLENKPPPSLALVQSLRGQSQGKSWEFNRDFTQGHLCRAASFKEPFIFYSLGVKCGMLSRKVTGCSKGKQNVPKPPKRIDPVLSFSNEEDDCVNMQAMLDQLAVLEKAQGRNC